MTETSPERSQSSRPPSAARGPPQFRADIWWVKLDICLLMITQSQKQWAKATHVVFQAARYPRASKTALAPLQKLQGPDSRSSLLPWLDTKQVKPSCVHTIWTTKGPGMHELREGFHCLDRCVIEVISRNHNGQLLQNFLPCLHICSFQPHHQRDFHTDLRTKQAWIMMGSVRCRKEAHVMAAA